MSAMKRFLPLLVAPVLLSACAGVPYEDKLRQLDLSWNLTPEDFGPTTQTVEQGELFFEWTAEAPATHAITIGSTQLPVAAVETSLGQLYCSFDGDNNGCYEDRDANGRVDRKWNANKTKNAPFVISNANDPVVLEAEFTITALKDSEEIIATQKLGLVYDGPYRANVDDDGALSSFISTAQIGWHSGKTAPRDPSGAGWSSENVMLLVLVEDKKAETIINELGFKYTPLKANVDGTIELKHSAVPVERTKVHEKFDVDFSQAEEEKEEPGV